MSEPQRGGADPARTEDAEAPELSWADTAKVVPVVVRTGLLAGQRLITWTASSTMFVTRSAVATLGGDGSRSGLFGALRDGVVASMRDALGVTELEADLRRLRGRTPPAPERTKPTPDSAAEPTPDSAAEPTPDPAAEPTPDPAAEPTPDPAAEPTPDPAAPGSLRERGRQLLDQSAALEADEEHPAFGLVLEQIAPDEMRLLRVMARDGDQAVVDVESGGVLSGGARVVARRLSILAETAGCKHPDRLPVYLDNLERLGVIRVGEEPLDDGDYQVIEAQPRVAEAREEASRGASRARMIRRRLGLTDFGSAFCAGCLPKD